ncbi:MAG: hypothetical protein P8N02_13500 [Actinomycetota bacterium]|jgi:hypothetical protein|nr:hypothetical protein [Actinomycetota bacterium]
MSDNGGTVIRGDDGALYFIRDEMLDAARVTEPDMVQFCESLLDEHDDEVAGFAFSTSSYRTLAFSGPFQQAGPNLSGGMNTASTIMCPGVMKDSSFVVRPSFRR